MKIDSKTIVQMSIPRQREKEGKARMTELLVFFVCVFLLEADYYIILLFLRVLFCHY